MDRPKTVSRLSIQLRLPAICPLDQRGEDNKRWFVVSDEKYIVGNMWDMGNSFGKKRLSFPMQPTNGFSSGMEANKYLKKLIYYIEDKIAVPTKKRSGSSKWWN